MPPRLRFRTRPRPSDVAAVKRITGGSGFFNAEEVAIAQELVRERLKNGTASGYFFVFADQGPRGKETVAGYSCYGPIGGTADSHDFYWIAVDDRIRGGGIGRALVKETEKGIAALGGRRVYVETSSRKLYEPTRAFYRACGYREETRLKDFYGKGDSKVFFVKVLPRPR